MYKLVQDVHNVPLVTNGLRRPIQRQFMSVYRNFHWGNIGEETPYCPDEQWSSDTQWTEFLTTFFLVTANHSLH